MEDASINSDLIRGHINTIILKALFDGDKYGYEICKDVEVRTKGKFILKKPTLYSALKRLEKEGYITSYWGGTTSNGGRCRYYSITELGREISSQNISEWEYSRTVIDKLISENDYDLSKDAPAQVDFDILKKSTTRVYTPNRNQEAFDDNLVEDNEETITNDEGNNFSSLDSLAEDKKTDKDLLTSKNDYKNDYDYGSRKESEKEKAYRLILGELLDYLPKNALSPLDCEENQVAAAEENFEIKEESVYDYKKQDFEENPDEIDDYEMIIKEEIKKELHNQNDNRIYNYKIDEEENEENNQEMIIEPKSDYKLISHRQTYAPADLSEIRQIGEMNGIRVREYTSTPISKDKGERKNKLTSKFKILFTTSSAVYIVSLLEVIIFALATNSIIDVKPSIYFAICSILLLFPCVFLVLYVLYPTARFNKNIDFKNVLFTSFIVFLNVILVLFALFLILDINLNDKYDLLLKLVLPSILSFNIPLFAVLLAVWQKISNKPALTE